MSEPTKAIFLSYAREDVEPAKHIAEALRAFGVEVWFDQNELRGGDSWDAKIRNQIKTCALFVPIVSQRTEERSEGYFRREWKLAIDRTNDMAGDRAFIVPVVIDETREAEAAVPEEFMRYQWTRLAGGAPTPEFVSQVKRLLDAPKKSAVRPGAGLTEAVRPVSPTPAAAGPAAPPSRLPLILGAVAVIAIAAAVFFALRSGPKDPTGAVRPIVVAEAKPVAPNPSEPKPAPAAPTINPKSIAVLPFNNMSEEKDSGFFSDGIHEDILTNLALVRELQVVSRTSVMQYRTTTKTVRQIAAELGVAYVLEGSVRRAGNKVRVTGQLIRAASDEHVWAKSYDRDLTDVFLIQSELATAIAGALSAALSPQEKQLLNRRPTENLAAYDAYMKARQKRQDTSTAFMAEPFLLTAVQLDPKFAQAWAELGSLHAFTYFNDLDHSAERLAKAKAAIETAVRLAPDDPTVIEMFGDYYYYGYRDYARASEQYQRLAVLRPNDAAVFGSLGFIHRRQGRWAEALSELRRAAQLEPRIIRYTRTLAQLAAGLNFHDEAWAVQQQVVAVQPEAPLEALALATLPLYATGSRQELQDLLTQLKPGLYDAPSVTYLRLLAARTLSDLPTAIRLDQQQPYYDVFGEPHWAQDVSAGIVLMAHGDTAAARARVANAKAEGLAELERKPSATTWVALSGLYVILGDQTEALRCAQAAKDLVPETKDAIAGPPLSLNHALILAWCGEKDRALAELARLLRTPFGENIHNARLSYFWQPLHDDPRFQALVNDPKNNAPLF